MDTPFIVDVSITPWFRLTLRPWKSPTNCVVSPKKTSKSYLAGSMLIYCRVFHLCAIITHIKPYKAISNCHGKNLHFIKPDQSDVQCYYQRGSIIHNFQSAVNGNLWHLTIRKGGTWWTWPMMIGQLVIYHLYPIKYFLKYHTFIPVLDVFIEILNHIP